jgi:transposase-like protein
MTTQLRPDEVNLVKLAQEYADDDKARALLESWRWPNGPVCPHCRNDGKEKPNSKLEAQAGSKFGVRKGVYFCGACREQFSVTVGTIFESSHLPIGTWLMAIFIMASSKKSVSAHQLHRMLGITYKSAWFLAHRIRHAMGPDLPLGKLLKGTVEVDETFVGGVGDARTKASRKTPVVALVKRDGSIQTRVVANVTQRNLGRIINECVDKDAIINTDDSGVYRGQLKAFKGHHVVNHSAEEYARENEDGSVAHVNTAESFFSLLKRGVIGSWHHVSREHLPKYANEFGFRWTNRKMSDGERMQKAVKATAGKRLTYRQPIATGKSGFDLLVKRAESKEKIKMEKRKKIFREPTQL